MFYHQGVFDDMDFWAGSLLLVVVSLLEVLLFTLSFGADALGELNRGGKIRLPKGIIYIMKYITPAYLIFLLGGWLATSAPQYMAQSNIHIWIGRIAMVALFALLELLVYIIGRRDLREQRVKK